MIRRFAFAAVLLAGCGVSSTPAVEEGSSEGRASALALPLAAIDVSQVVPPASVTLSSASLAFDPRASFSTQTLGARLAPGEVFALRQKARALEASSAGWSYLFDAPKGFVVLDHLAEGFPVGPALTVKDDARLASLAQDARTRLSSLGVPTSEVAYVVSKAVMRDESAREPGSQVQRSVVEYKIFAARAIGGIAIDGSRAVLTYSTDGRLTNLLARWPKLASAGHRLSTSLTASAIASRVADALGNDAFAVAAAQTEKIRVRLVYVPTSQPDGTVTLSLQAEAAVSNGHDGPSLAAPRVYFVAL